MKWLPSKDNYWFYIIIFLLICFIINILFFKKPNNITKTKFNIKEIDSILINYRTIDSIKYEIKYKDSLIIKTKYIYEEELVKANNLNNDDAVSLFKELCTE